MGISLAAAWANRTTPWPESEIESTMGDFLKEKALGFGSGATLSARMMLKPERKESSRMPCE
jgi:hypothetical protein